MPALNAVDVIINLSETPGAISPIVQMFVVLL